MRGFTQEALSVEAGCSCQAVGRIENGYEPPFSDRGARIAKALGWRGDIETLFSDSLTESEILEALRVHLSDAA